MYTNICKVCNKQHKFKNKKLWRAGKCIGEPDNTTSSSSWTDFYSKSFVENAVEANILSRRWDPLTGKVYVVKN